MTSKSVQRRIAVQTAGMKTVYLSRRNLTTLLSKLDRLAAGDATTCAIVKFDTVHPKYPTSEPTVLVAIEDADYYTDREPGAVLPEDEPSVLGAGCGLAPMPTEADLRDAAAYFRKEADAEASLLREGGGSRIAKGQYERYEAAIRALFKKEKP